MCCGYEGHNYPQPPKAELEAAEKAEAEADAEREAVLKAVTEAPRCGPNEICHVSPAEAMVAEKALAKQLAAAEAAAEAAAVGTEADAAALAKEELTEEVAVPPAAANATAANATARPEHVRTPLLSWRPTNQTGPTDEPRVHGSKGRVRDRTVLKLELFGKSYRPIGALEALEDERWYAQPSPEPKTVEPQPNPHPNPNRNPCS